MFKKATISDDQKSMPLMQHLVELRSRLIKSVIIFVIAIGITNVCYNYILDFVTHPLCSANIDHCKLILLSPLDGLAVRIKITAYSALLLSFPFISYQLMKFIAPGLTKKERKYLYPIYIAIAVFFLLGAGIAYVTYSHALQWLTAVAGNNLYANYTADKYISLLLALMLIFGVTFEFPVVLVGLELLRVVTYVQLKNFRRYAMILITIAGGVLTPSSDPFSMFAMIIPLYIFYELAIIVGRIFVRSSPKVTDSLN